MSVLEIGFWWWVILSVLGLVALVIGAVCGLIVQRSKVRKPVRSYEMDDEDYPEFAPRDPPPNHQEPNH